MLLYVYSLREKNEKGKDMPMRSRVILLGGFEELYEESPMLTVNKCAFCGCLFTEEEGTIEEQYSKCPYCHEDLE